MTKSWLFLLLPGLLQAQAAVGRLIYTNPAGRAMSFKVVEAGPSLITLASETGDAAAVRAYVLAHAGDQVRLARGARILPNPVPANWQGSSGTTDLLQTVEVTYWRYAPGQVLPARFSCGGQIWQLLTAGLPPGRTFSQP